MSTKPNDNADSGCCGGGPAAADCCGTPSSPACCGSSPDASSETKHNVRSTVQQKYGEIASTGQSCCNTSASSSCCATAPGGSKESYAQALGYTAAELAALPEGANMGLSCGNPTAIASLKQGEVVLDLGCGGGFDVFIAAKKVGATGRVVGVDMTPAMLNKARSNAIKFTERTGLNNVEFRLGEIEHLPVADSSVDVIISNCVSNLSPDKEQVWREVARVLKPGGRACISDVALLRPLPDSLRESVYALVGCVAGAVMVDDTACMIQEAGMVVSSAEKESAFVQEMESSDDPLYKDIIKQAPEGTSPRDYVTSLRLVATKPE